jgi:hypothetical protein
MSNGVSEWFGVRSIGLPSKGVREGMREGMREERGGGKGGGGRLDPIPHLRSSAIPLCSLQSTNTPPHILINVTTLFMFIIVLPPPMSQPGVKRTFEEVVVGLRLLHYQSYSSLSSFSSGSGHPLARAHSTISS